MFDRKNKALARDASITDMVHGEEVSEALPLKNESGENKFERAGKILFWVIAGLLPLWIIPLPVGAEFGREVTFAVFTVVITLLWLLSILTTGEVRFSYSPALWGGFLLIVISAVSSLLSIAPYVSFLFADSVAERFSTLVMGLLLMLLAGVVFRAWQDVRNFIYILIFGSAISAVISLVQIFFQFNAYSYLSPLASGEYFNVLGTTNGLALFYAVLLMVTSGLLLGNLEKRKTRVTICLYASSLLFLVNLVVINFRTVWFVLIGSGVFLFGLVFRMAWENAPERGRITLGSKQIAVLGLLAFSILMLFIKLPLPASVAIPLEISPSFRATLNIGQKVFAEEAKNIALGSGPGTFGLGWARYKDPSVNQTIFWQVRFNQGFSWVSTLFVTTGVLGVLALLLFLTISLILSLRRIIDSSSDGSSFGSGIFLGMVALVLVALLYPANFSLILLLFIFIGLLSYLGGFAKDEHNRFLKISHVTFSLRDPWITFASSLISVFFIALSTAVLYLQFEKVRVTLLGQSIIEALGRGGIDEAIAGAEKVAITEDKNFRSFLLLGQVRIEKLRSLIQRAAAGEMVEQDFQVQASSAIQNIQQGVLLNPRDPALWETQGSLYELIIPFIQGSEQFAFDSYKKAAELDPANPIYWVSIGRAGVSYADKLQLIAGQAQANQKVELENMRIGVLKQSSEALARAISLKADYAPAHFMMTQTALRLGNIADAIRSSENAKFSAPFDIGIAFQLGLLNYQNGDLARAEEEFLRAVSLNENYSNARYFLGLIYDRRGERARAIEEFERVASLNPDNQEVQRILSNLRGGKSALTSIAPPGTPPEKRKEAPVPENNR